MFGRNGAARARRDWRAEGGHPYSSDIILPFDAPGHPADLANAAALYSLRANGAELCRSLVY